MSDAPTAVVQPRPPQPSAESSHDGVDLSLVPKHKVGRHLVYDKYPAAYDQLMHRHDCSAVRQILHREAAALRSALPKDYLPSFRQPADGDQTDEEKELSSCRWCRVADFGCGTGRLALMLSDVTATLTAADAAAPMLVRLQKHLTHAALFRTIRLAPSPPEQLPSLPRPTTSSTATLYASSFEKLLLPSRVAEASVVCPCPACSSPSAGDEGTTAAPPPTALALQPWADPVFDILPGSGRHDLVVCGWSLSFVMTALWGETRWHTAVYRAIYAMAASLDPATGGTVCVVETLGNFSDAPVRCNSLHTYLGESLGFTHEWVRTDYRFATAEEAQRSVLFFFGSKVAERLKGEPDPLVLRECTGVWTKRFAPHPTLHPRQNELMGV